LLLACQIASAQDKSPADGTFDATLLRAPEDLGGTWLVHGGDDPAFARTDFDDSKWAALDLKKSLRTQFSKAAEPQVVWYRLHVKLAPDQTDLALSERNISTAIELYVNGIRLLKAGEISPFKPYTSSARNLLPIPNEQSKTGSLVIAVRVYVSRSAWSEPNPGMTPRSISLGREHQLYEHGWLSAIGRNANYWVNLLLVFGLGMVALALFIAQPKRREYLWIFLQFVSLFAAVPFSFYLLFHEIPEYLALIQLPLNIMNFLFQIMMYLAFIKQRFTLWMRIYFGITGTVAAACIIGVSTGVTPAVYLGITLIPFLLYLNAIMPILLILHWRRGNREAGILLIPSLLTGATSYLGLVIFFLSEIPALASVADRIDTFIFSGSIGPFQINIEDVANLFFYLSLLLILVLRSTRMSRQQAVFEGELEAAREVQQVILPEQLDTIPGFTIESVYEPAQQVGGDFFQVLPNADGGMLLVVGDVAGKGLPAAMLVSMLVGAIRTVAEDSVAPEIMLAKLNERLIGRSRGGFSTALAAYITSEGQVTIANAGHLSPYLDGHEFELPGALPLGILSGATYETTQFHLSPGSRLTFYSDGVIEAQNAKGELFGFDRGREISTEPASAIVSAAKLFGQSDDITVVAITRSA
jgi:hypothetical protein